MDKCIGLFPNAYEELAYNMCLPGQLSWIGDMLPVTATFCEQGIGRIDALWRRAQYLQKHSACMPTAFFDNFHTYPLAWNAARDKEYTAFITTYGVASIGEICEFNINAHVHLQTALLTV